MSLFRAAIASALLLLVAVDAHAETTSPPDDVVEDEGGRAFDRLFAISVYGAASAGSYDARGVGGRARIEPFSWVGLEVFAEGLIVDWPGADRYDLPAGFSVYFPWSLTDWLRLRPLAGLCVAVSVVDPDHGRSAHADDIQFGAHAGVGLEAAIANAWSLFVEGRGFLWFGHERYGHGWNGDLGEELHATGAAQLTLGIQLHL